MMKKMMALLACLLLGASCALAAEEASLPHEELAICVPQGGAQRVALFEAADEKSTVLMEYFSGVQVDVTGSAEKNMVPVRVGECLEGYMRQEDLRFGPEAMRDAKGYTYLPVTAPTELPMYPVCDESAEPMNVFLAGTELNIIGLREDGMMHVEGESQRQHAMLLNGAQVNAAFPDPGFVKMPAGSWTMETAFMDYGVFPRCEGEITAEEALSLAVEAVLSGACSDPYGVLDALSQETKTEAGLRALPIMISIRQGPEGRIWEVVFSTETFNGESFAVLLSMDGKEILSLESSNG